MQAVGQLDQHNAHILAHGQECFSQSLRYQILLFAESSGSVTVMTISICIGSLVAIGHFGMLVVARDTRQIGQLGHAVHQDSNRPAEIAADILEGYGGILHCVVKQTRRDHFRRDVQVRQDGGHRKTVIDIWLA